ncbi:MAG: hypothetical protein HC912_04075 [Saprospiraceae bacterium]|nr:hypothetical protein [Saprospiraceae bacterium]
MQPTCAESSNGTIEFSVSGGEGNYSYAWSNGSFSPILTGISGGTYTFTITDTGGLSTDGVVTLAPANPSPIANAGADANLSCGASITLLMVEHPPQARILFTTGLLLAKWAKYKSMAASILWC